MNGKISANDVVLARDWKRLEGRRARPKPVYGNKEWYRLNRDHDIVTNARRQIYNLESLYGTVVEK
jgi:hypothetical protein